MNSLELLILNSLINNKEYFNAVINHIRPEFFDGDVKTIINLIKKYSLQYQEQPSIEVLKISIDNLTSSNQESYNNLVDTLKSVAKPLENQNYKWLIDETEKYCKHKAVKNALLESVTHLKNKDKVDESILSLLEDALSVSFNDSIGYDYVETAEQRLQSYKETTERFPIHINLINKITNGGVKPKTLNAIMGGTGAGKSVFLCDISKCYLEQGYNVLYITAEMSEAEIAQRIDANILDINQEQLSALNVKENLKRIMKVKNDNKGKLIIKEFPTSTATALDIKKVIDDLQLKKKIDIDIMIVDYINILNSYRYTSKNSNTYTTAKSVAEELRGLAVRYNIPIWTATQQNRSTYNSDDVGLENTSESIGVPQTLDLFLAIITTEELSKNGNVMFKQLKNRYGDINNYTRFIVGIDRAKARFFNTKNPEVIQIESKVDLSDKFKSDKQQDDYNAFTF